MATKRRPKFTQQKIDSILDQLKKALPLPPSKSFLKATESALEIFIERNFWHVLISLDSIFYNLIEFSKKPGVVNDFKEMRQSHLFANLFLRKYQTQYSLFAGIYIRDRENYTKGTPISKKPKIEIDDEAGILFEQAVKLAKNIFSSKMIQGEHLLLSFFSPLFPRLREFFVEQGVVKEELLLEWIKAMNLSIEELSVWRKAFEFIECEVDLDNYIAKREKERPATRDEVQEVTREIKELTQEMKAGEENINETLDALETLEESLSIDGRGVDNQQKSENDDEEVENWRDWETPDTDDDLNYESHKEEGSEKKEVTALVISREELGRTPAQADEPASKLDNDLLGRKNLVEALAELIADKNQGTPFTIGLLGRWGAGKSTVMKMLQDVLRSREDGQRFKFAEFNAWEYERTDNLEAGLAQEVVRSLVEPLGFRKKLSLRYEFALREHGPKVLISLIFAALIFSGIFAEFALVISKLGVENKEWWFETIFGGGLVLLSLKLWDHYKKVYEHPLSVELRTYLKLPDYGKHLGLIPVLKRHIRTLCHIRLGTPQEQREKRKEELKKWDWLSLDENKGKVDGLSNRLVVFIDDLDRCDPKSITKTLDAVRLVMDVKDVIVILGIDHRIAFRAVGDHYKDLADNRHSKQAIARDYLGKILQLAIVVNQPQEKELKSFVSQGLFPNVELVVEEDKVQEEVEQEEVEQEEVEQEEVEQEEVEQEEVEQEEVEQEEVEQEEVEQEEESIWREEIKVSVKERDLFLELAEVFQISNPRQLLRMRNSYGILKLLYGMGSVIPFTPYYKEQAPKELRAILLILLFWKEFESNHPNWGYQVEEYSKGNLNTSETPVDSVVLKIADRMSQPDIGGLDFSFTGLTGVANFVERFVLPSGEMDEPDKRDQGSKSK